jgi:hypothetical protein
MAILPFIFEQLFVLLVPQRVVRFEVVSDRNFPLEAEFVQKLLSIWSHFVLVMVFPLRMNPPPKK